VPAPDRPPATVVPLVGQRIVADPASIDAIVAAIPAQLTTLRFAPDEALVIGATAIVLDDPHAIVEDEVGFVAVTVDRAVVARHTEWTPPDRGGVAQGAIAGVPAKLAWLPDGRAWIVTQAAYLADLLDRLT
jgi:hypothetical protein